MQVDSGFLAGEWAYFTGAVVTIFFIVDPFGVVPTYLSLAERFSPADRRHMRVKATIIATLILVGIAVSGTRFFQLFGITLPAFQIGGGLLLLMVGIRQVNDPPHRVAREEESESFARDDITLFPLATPLLAGPAAISTVILYTTREPSLLRLAELIIAIMVVMGLSLLVLSASSYLLRVLGKTGINILTRLMGLVLTAVAVQFILNGLGEAFRTFVPVLPK